MMCFEVAYVFNDIWNNIVADNYCGALHGDGRTLVCLLDTPGAPTCLDQGAEEYFVKFLF